MTKPFPAMFHKQLSLAGREWRGSITTVPSGGWDVREQLDDRVLRQVRLSDWHRVERARTVLSLKAASLEATGWSDAEHHRQTKTKTRTARAAH